MNSRYLIMATLLLAVGISTGWWLGRQHPEPQQSGEKLLTTQPAVSPTEPTVLYWFDPMMPEQHFDKPGKSPYMDMELLPKYAESSLTAESQARIHIDSALSENIGMRLAPVTRQPWKRQTDVSGLIAFNERDVAIIQSRTAGFVEQVWPLTIGDVISSGQAIAEILVPEWAAVQQEFLAVQRMGDSNLLDAARERLHLSGLPASLIQQLEQTGMVQTHYTVKAPITGMIQNLDLRNGMTVSNGQTLARINGLSRVWLDVALPESQADLARTGNPASVKLTGADHQSLSGQISAILPSLNESSRSIRVRIELNNPQLQLRPGQSAQVKLESADQDSVLTVPTEALIRTGKRTLVMRADKNGHYFPTEVSAGHEMNNQTQIISGLTEGQQVVASGQFLIDSEARLSGIVALTRETAP